MKIIKSKIIGIDKGKNFTVVNPVNIYGAKFGDNCFVGPFTEIQKNVVFIKVEKESKSYIFSFSDREKTFINVKNAILESFNYLKDKKVNTLVEERTNKFTSMGVYNS